MSRLQKLFSNNRQWIQDKLEKDPAYFKKLAELQSPRYLWIGCSDSRVPANQIVGLMPGEVFVHRNVANLVVHTDMNCLSVIQYAVEVLEIKDIIVCGHYGCGGIKAACDHKQIGLIDNWLRHIKDVYDYHYKELESIEHYKKRLDKLCELNVIEQVRNVCHTTIVQNAWAGGKDLAVHGLVYGLNDGVLKDLGFCVTSQEQLSKVYKMHPIEERG